MANVLVTPTLIMKEVGRLLVNKLRFAATVNRDYSDQYAVTGAKVGYTVQARLPQRYRVVKGQGLVVQPVQDRVTNITLTDQAHVGIEFSSASLTLEIDDYRKRYIAPAVATLAATADADGLARTYKKVAHTVGTPGVVPGSTGTLPAAANLVYMAAAVKLANIGAPDDRLVAMLSPNMQAYLTSANLALFNPQRDISEAWRTGQFGGEALGISEWFSTQNVATHTVGPLGGTPVVSGAGQTGSSITTSGWTAAAAKRLNAGDVIQFAGVYDLNEQTYQSTGDLKDFVVTADVYSAADGTATIPIDPPLTASGQNQNASGSPADSAAITIFGHASSYANKTSPQGLVFDPDAVAFVMADLELPGGLWVSERIANKALGIAVRFLKDYDIRSDSSPARLDILYGWAVPQPELAVRVAS